MAHRLAPAPASVITAAELLGRRSLIVDARHAHEMNAAVLGQRTDVNGGCVMPAHSVGPAAVESAIDRAVPTGACTAPRVALIEGHDGTLRPGWLKG